MGLYLCVFDDGDEIDGVGVGPYADLGALRDYITGVLEQGQAGTNFQRLLLRL
jgi:hypothetical protein